MTYYASFLLVTYFMCKRLHISRVSAQAIYEQSRHSLSDATTSGFSDTEYLLNSSRLSIKPRLSVYRTKMVLLF